MNNTKTGARIEAKVEGTFEVWNNNVLIATCDSQTNAKLVLHAVSQHLDSRTEWTFADGLAKSRNALSRLRSSGELLNSRAAALVETKLDEAELWFTRVR